LHALLHINTNTQQSMQQSCNRACNSCNTNLRNGINQVVVNYLKDAIVELTTHERVRWCYICVLIQAYYYICVSSY
jgi:hypothetical protein